MMKDVLEYSHYLLDLFGLTQERHVGYFWRTIKFSSRETNKISGFIEEKGRLEIYYKHPLIKKYISKKGLKNRIDFLTFVADIITREAIKSIVNSAIKENKFIIFDIDRPELEIEEYITNKYYNEGPKMHALFIELVRGLKLEE